MLDLKLDTPLYDSGIGFAEVKKYTVRLYGAFYRGQAKHLKLIVWFCRSLQNELWKILDLRCYAEV